jgi:hypothetical protein
MKACFSIVPNFPIALQRGHDWNLIRRRRHPAFAMLELRILPLMRL